MPETADHKVEIVVDGDLLSTSTPLPTTLTPIMGGSVNATADYKVAIVIDGELVSASNPIPVSSGGGYSLPAGTQGSVPFYDAAGTELTTDSTNLTFNNATNVLTVGGLSSLGSILTPAGAAGSLALQIGTTDKGFYAPSATSINLRVAGQSIFTASNDGSLTLAADVGLTVHGSGSFVTLNGASISFGNTTGTPPFGVTSTTVVSNLNADTVDGSHASAFFSSAGGTLGGTLILPTDGSTPTLGFGSSSTGIRGTANDLAIQVASSELIVFSSPTPAIDVPNLVVFNFNMTTGSGLPPFTVDSTYVVTNLNADLLDGLDSADFAGAGHDHDATYVNTSGDTMTGNLLFSPTDTHNIGAENATMPSKIYANDFMYVGAYEAPFGLVTTGYYAGVIGGGAGFTARNTGSNLEISMYAGTTTCTIGTGTAHPLEFLVGNTIRAIMDTSMRMAFGSATITTTTSFAVNPTNFEPGANAVGIAAIPTFGNGVTTAAASLYAQLITTNESFTMARGTGLEIASSAKGASATITDLYGQIIRAQTQGGTGNYGLAIEAATTQTLWVGSAADSTTAAAGIAFGLSRDTTLYRLEAGGLRHEASVNGRIRYSVRNGSTGASASTGIYAEVNGSGTADPFVAWNIEGVRLWYAGVDNSDSDIWKLAQNIDGTTAFAGGVLVQVHPTNFTFQTYGQVYPGQPAGGMQTAAGLLAGSGVPNNAFGNNGDFYFRSDGTAAGNTVVYHKEAGAWVALTTT